MLQASVWVWLDLEMTGLDPVTDHILEVSCVLTTPELREFNVDPFSEVIHYTESVLENMSDWCIENHEKSGLTESVRQSQYSLEAVQKSLIAYLRNHTLPTDTLYLAGNSIHMDRAFIKQHMQGLESLLHYRMIDVTSVGMVAEAMGIPSYQKNAPHRAMEDIRLSIAELKYYQEQFLGLSRDR